MKACRKFLALILSLSLLDFGGISNQVYAADPPPFSSAISAKGSKEKLDPRSITQPLQPYARIGQYFSSTQKEGPTLIHIRDLHCNYEAQINISKTLESLSAELKKSGHLHEEPLLVLTEGADGQVDTSLFASFPDNEIRTQAAREFVKAGKMTGPEYLSIAKPYEVPLQIVGIEEGNLYVENLKAFRDVIGQRQMTESFIKDVNERLEMFKQKAFSKELLEMDQKESGYESGAIAFDEYARFLSQKTQNSKLEIQNYPNFKLLVEVLEKQKSIVVDEVENERNKVMDELSDKVSKDDLAKLIKRSLEFRLGKITAQEYFEELDRLIGEHLQKKSYPNLGQYIELVKLQSGVDHRLLLDEVEDMTSKVRESLVKTAEEKELLEFSHQIDIVGKMFKLEMTREDLAFYKENKKLCNVESVMKQLDKFVLKYGLDIPTSLKGEAKVRQYTKVFEDGDRFYEMALQRDQAMMAKSMQAMEGKNIQVAVLITGGFHSEGVTELLERKDVAYVVATPKVSGEPDMTGYYNLMLDERITVATIAFVSLFNGIAGKVSESLQGQELDKFADLLMRLMANKGIKNEMLTGWIDRWIEQKGGVEKLRESQPAMEQLVSRLQSQLSPAAAGQQAALMTDQMIQELMNSPNIVTAELTVEVLREMGHPQLEQIEKQLDARRRGLYSSMDEMAQGLPKAIGEKLQQSGLEAGEAKAAVRLIDLVKGLYEAMGLMKKGYHNQVHNLGVVFANLTIATSSGLAKAPRDVKVAFLAAMLHDFHVREPTMIKDGKEQGTPAFVEETMKQLRDLLGLPLPNGPPQEGRYNNTVTDEMKSEFRNTINELMGQENLADLLTEAEAMIRRTDFASNVAPPPQQAGYVKAQAAESRKNMDSLITQGRSLTDIRSAVEQNYEKIYQAVEADEKLNADQKQMARTWLDRQKGIELAYLDALSKSSQDRQIQVHQLANRLEKGADQSGFYWLTTPEMVEREVVPGLQEEIPMVNVAGSYPFFFVPELLNPEVLVILKDLPFEYKKNLIEVMRHFSKKSAEAGAKMPDSVPVKGLFQGAQADWQKREPDVLAKLGLEIGSQGAIREVAAPVISIAAAKERVTQTVTEGKERETFEKAKEGAEFHRAAAGPIEVRTEAPADVMSVSQDLRIGKTTLEGQTAVAESLPVVQEIASALRQGEGQNGSSAVILGSPGSGKTEQLEIALKRRAPVFDLRGEFIEGKDRAFKDRYKTDMALKAEELDWMGANYERKKQELLKSTDDSIIFDEFDLAVGEKLEGSEIETAKRVVDLASDLMKAGKRVVLILHSKGMRTPELMRHLADQGLLESEEKLIKTKYLSQEMEASLLSSLGLNEVQASRFANLAEGIPAAYLGFIEHLAKIAMGLTTELYESNFDQLIEKAESQILKNYRVAVKTGSPTIAQLLRDLATGERSLQDSQVLAERDRLLDTGLIGERDGQLVMPEIVQNIIQVEEERDINLAAGPGAIDTRGEMIDQLHEIQQFFRSGHEIQSTLQDAITAIYAEDYKSAWEILDQTLKIANREYDIYGLGGVTLTISDLDRMKESIFELKDVRQFIEKRDFKNAWDGLRKMLYQKETAEFLGSDEFKVVTSVFGDVRALADEGNWAGVRDRLQEVYDVNRLEISDLSSTMQVLHKYLQSKIDQIHREKTASMGNLYRPISIVMDVRNGLAQLRAARGEQLLKPETQRELILEAEDIVRRYDNKGEIDHYDPTVIYLSEKNKDGKHHLTLEGAIQDEYQQSGIAVPGYEERIRNVMALLEIRGGRPQFKASAIKDKDLMEIVGGGTATPNVRFINKERILREHVAQGREITPKDLYVGMINDLIRPMLGMTPEQFADYIRDSKEDLKQLPDITVDVDVLFEIARLGLVGRFAEGDKNSLARRLKELLGAAITDAHLDLLMTMIDVTDDGDILINRQGVMRAEEQPFADIGKLAPHGVVNAYIGANIPQNLRDSPSNIQNYPEAEYQGTKARVIAIPGLFRKTGQLAHIGLGQVYGQPVIYADSDYSGNQTVMNHELHEIGKWEEHRNKLGLKPSEMRNWIKNNLAEARELANRWHREAPSVEQLLADARANNADHLAAIDQIYPEEDNINLAAGPPAEAPALALPVETPANVSFGTICEEAHRLEFTGLNAQIKNVFDNLRENLGKEDQAFLSEEEADQAIRNAGTTGFDFEAQRREIQDFLGPHLSKEQAMPKIFFIEPSGNQYLFWVNDEYAAAHYSVSNNSIYISLPVAQYSVDVLGPSAINAIAFHEFAHLSGLSHEEAEELHRGVNHEVDELISLMVEEEREQMIKEKIREEERGESWTAAESASVTQFAEGIEVQSQSAPEWQSYSRLDMPRAQGLNELDWFKETIVTNTDSGEDNLPKSFEEAIKDWQIELVSYPYEMSRCAFGHRILWGFNYVHPKKKIRIELGQDEIVHFGLIGPPQKEELKKSYREQIQNANDQWLYLRNYLSIIGKNLGAVLAREGISDEDKVKLKALAKIASMQGYYGMINVFDQKIAYQGGFLNLSYEDLEKYITIVGELVDEGVIKIDRHKILPTELQRLRLQIASAVSQAQRGDPSGWDRIAAKYSNLLENISAFSIKVATLLRFLGSLESSRPEDAKTPQELKRWAFLGSGPAIGVRSLTKIGGVLNTLGINVPNLQFNDVDFSQPMLDEGKKAVEQEGNRLGQNISYNPVQSDIVNQSVPLQDNSADVIETGIAGTLGEEENQQGLNKKIHLLLEMNRVLDQGGYLILTFKNKPLPQEFQDALARHFGFKILTSSQPYLGYEKSTLERITHGDQRKADKLRSHLQDASYLVAVKEKTLTSEEIQSIKEHQSTIAKTLIYDDSYEAQQRTAKARQSVSQPQEVNIENLGYSDLKLDQFTKPVLNREIIMSDPAYQDFEERLTSLIWLKKYLSEKEKRTLTAILELWDRQRASSLTEEQVSFVMDRSLEKEKAKYFTYDQLVREFPHLKKLIDDDQQLRLEIEKEKLEKLRGRGLALSGAALEEVNAELKKFERQFKSARFSFWDMYQLESRHRIQRSLKPVFDESRPLWIQTVQGVRKAVAKLKSAGETPSISAVAMELALKRNTLEQRVLRYGINLAEFGVVLGTVDKEKRIQEIRDAVEKIKKQGKMPYLAAVKKEVGTDFTGWAEANDIRLEDLGVEKNLFDVEKRVQEIEAAVKKIKEQGKIPNLKTVTREIGLSRRDALWRWAKENDINLRDLGVTVQALRSVNQDKRELVRVGKILDVAQRLKQPEELKMWEQRVQEVKDSAGRIKEQGKIPSLKAVATELGLSPSELLEWAHDSGVNFSDLGVVVDRSPVEKEERVREIKEAVEKLKRQGKIPNLRIVAKELGLTAIGLSNWARDNGVSLEDLGAMQKSRVDNERRIQDIEMAVERLSQQGKTPTVANVAKEVGLANGTVLSVWAQRQGVNLVDLGVIVIKKTHMQEVEKTPAETAPGLKEDSPKEQLGSKKEAKQNFLDLINLKGKFKGRPLMFWFNYPNLWEMLGESYYQVEEGGVITVLPGISLSSTNFPVRQEVSVGVQFLKYQKLDSRGEPTGDATEGNLLVVRYRDALGQNQYEYFPLYGHDGRVEIVDDFIAERKPEIATSFDSRGYGGEANITFTEGIQAALVTGSIASFSRDASGQFVQTEFPIKSAVGSRRVGENIGKVEQHEKMGEITETQIENLNRVIGELGIQAKLQGTTIIFYKGKTHYGVGRNQIYLDVALLDNPVQLKRELYHEAVERSDVMEGLIREGLIQSEDNMPTESAQRNPALVAAIERQARESHDRLVKIETQDKLRTSVEKILTELLKDEGLDNGQLIRQLGDKLREEGFETLDQESLELITEKLVPELRERVREKGPMDVVDPLAQMRQIEAEFKKGGLDKEARTGAQKEVREALFMFFAKGLIARAVEKDERFFETLKNELEVESPTEAAEILFAYIRQRFTGQVEKEFKRVLDDKDLNIETFLEDRNLQVLNRELEETNAEKLAARQMERIEALQKKVDVKAGSPMAKEVRVMRNFFVDAASPVLNRMNTLIEIGTIAKVGEVEDRNIFVVDVLALVKEVGEKDGKIKLEGTGVGLDHALGMLFGVRPGTRIKLMSPYSEEQMREILKSLGVSDEQIGQGKGKVEIVGNWSEQGFQGIVRNALGVERLEGESREQAERDVVVVLSEETQKNLTEGREAEFKQEIKGMKVVVGKLGKEKGSHTIGDVLGMALVLGSVEKAFDEKGQMSPVLMGKLKSLFEPVLREILKEQGVNETEIETQVAQVIKDIAKEGFFRIPPVTDVFNDMMRELAIEETYIEVAA